MEMSQSNHDVIKRILASVRGDELLSFASALIRIPSVVGNAPGERAVAQAYIKEARRLGFQVETYELRGHNVPSPGRPSVVIRVPGRGTGPSLMFSGHFDTEPVAPGYAELGEDPFSGHIQGGYLYGLGSVNMKAAIATYLYALRALSDAEVSLAGDVVIACVVGEIEAGTGIRYLMEQGLRADMAVFGEPSYLRVCIAHACCVDVRIIVRGEPSHIAWPHRGRAVNAFVARFLDALPNMEITYDHTKYKGIYEPRVNLSYIHGGYEYRSGLYLDNCEFVLCVRGPHSISPMSVKADCERLLTDLKAQLPGFDVECTVLNPTPLFVPSMEVAPSEYLVDAVARAHHLATGREAEIGMRHYGYADAGPFQAATGAPCLIYGPGGESGSFTPPERVRADDVVAAAQVYALVAYDVCNQSWEALRGRYRVPV